MSFSLRQMHLLSVIAYADEDECATNNGGCGQNCTNTIGSYFCTCEEGFTLKADSHNCEGLL